MFLDSRILFILTETPLHAGAGSGLGVVDLPIQRERTTGYPIVQASGIKGALRSETKNNAKKVAIFGPEVGQVDEGSQVVSLHAGALSPGDARILLFPVRSLTGVFAWTTSMLALHRFQRDAKESGLTLPPLPINDPEANQVYVSGNGVAVDNKLVLEEYAFSVAEDQDANTKTVQIAKTLAEQALPADPIFDYWRTKLLNGLVILPNDAFRDFVMHATEVATRVRLEPDSKTVMRGALWTEEYLPTDTILYATVHATRLRIPNATATGWPEDAKEQAKEVIKWVTKEENIPHRLQLGGDETVGRGMVHIRWSGGAA